MMAKFDVDGFKNHLKTAKIGRTILYEEITGSTMDDARRLAHQVNDYPHGTAVLSERQTNARGAKDHKWDASNTGNIYVSFILHLPSCFKSFEGKYDLEVAACLAVLQVARKYGVVQAVPKWPNDIWVKGHKLAGFLAEDGRFDIPGSANSLIILGMGVNVNADTRRNADLHSIATSLFCERGGVAVDREAFFADVCAALETNLAHSREHSLDIFRRENLFQEHCSVSVTNLSLGCVIDAEFVAICGNWDIKFIDKSNNKTLQGNSETFSVRPKALRKILVVSTGIQNSKSAVHLLNWLNSLVDTSKYVVCMVPENSIISSDAWMASCALLILAEHVYEPDPVSSKLYLFLQSGGSVMANGMASHFLAKLLDVPLKEMLLESSTLNSDLGLVHLQVQTEVTSDQRGTSPPGDPDKQFLSVIPAANGREFTTVTASLEPLIFPTSPVCFQFFSQDNCDNISLDFVEESLKALSIDQPLVSNGDADASGKKVQLKAFYKNQDEQNKTVAVFTARLNRGGKVAFWGFDVGVVYPLISEEEWSKLEGPNEPKNVHADRFKRDQLLMRVLEILLH